MESEKNIEDSIENANDDFYSINAEFSLPIINLEGEKTCSREMQYTFSKKVNFYSFNWFFTKNYLAENSSSLVNNDGIAIFCEYLVISINAINRDLTYDKNNSRNKQIFIYFKKQFE